MQMSRRSLCEERAEALRAVMLVKCELIYRTFALMELLGIDKKREKKTMKK